MKVIRPTIKYLLLCPLVIAFFVATPVEAADSYQESKEEIEETKLYFRAPQSVRQKPKTQKTRRGFGDATLRVADTRKALFISQLPKYILFGSLILYE